MPFPDLAIPAIEQDPKERIKQKYQEYLVMYQRFQQNRLIDPSTNSNDVDGERYEIRVAVELYNAGKFSSGRQIGRHSSNGENQNLFLDGSNDKEYDFWIEATTKFARTPQIPGIILGEAKSYSGGLNTYILKAVSHCLCDPSLCGVLFVTPKKSYEFFLQMLYNAHRLLADPQAVPAMGGGTTWKDRPATATRPAGSDVIAYFKSKYFESEDRLTEQNYLRVYQGMTSEMTEYSGFRENRFTGRQQPVPHATLGDRRIVARTFNEELAEQAGIVLLSLTVAGAMDHANLVTLMSTF